MNRVILPLEEHASREISFGGTPVTGEGQILAGCDGRVYLGVSSDNALFMGVCIGGVYANYCWDVPSSLFAERHRYTISYSEGNYLLSIDGGRQRAFSKLNIDQNNVTEVNGVEASHELTEKIRAVTGQNFVKMTHIGADAHMCTNKITASPVNGYREPVFHPLHGKTVFYLGSSVTRGHGGDTDGVSFAEITNRLTGNAYQKEAVSGTTLAMRTDGDNSYASRLSSFDLSKKPDVLVVQLSTNDFSQGVALGAIAADRQTASASFDKTTVTGAIEYIIAAVKEQSPRTKVALYTCPLGANYGFRRQYGQYVNGTLKQLERKWDNLSVLDLFSGGYINVPAAYMQGDGLHPTKAGYAQVFTPKLINLISNL